MTNIWDNAGENSPEQFYHYLEELRKKGQAYKDLGSQLQTEGAFILDWVNRAQQVTPNYASGVNWTQVNEQANRWVSQLENSLSWLNHVGQGTATAYFSSTIETKFIESSVLQFREPPLDLPDQAYLQPTTISPDFGFSELPHRLEHRQRACEQFTRLGLDKTKKGQNALRQLNAAWDGHLQGLQSPTMALITIREAITMSINALLELLPYQQTTKRSERVQDIGRQVGLTHFTEDDFQRLNKEWYEVMFDELSQGKEGNYNRRDERELIAKSTLWLVRFLSTIDYNKLRK